MDDEKRKDCTNDENGNPAPMHDMSYYNKSVTSEIGLKLRNALGTDLIQRAKNTVDYLKKCGVDIDLKIFPGRTHNIGEGLDDSIVSDPFIDSTYIESLKLYDREEREE